MKVSIRFASRNQPTHLSVVTGNNVFAKIRSMHHRTSRRGPSQVAIARLVRVHGLFIAFEEVHMKKCRAVLPALFVAVLVTLSSFAAQPLHAQRLPDTVLPEHYSLTLTPDLKAATFSGVETIDVSIKAPTKHGHAELRRDRLPIRHGIRGREATDSRCHSRREQRAGHFHISQRSSRRQGVAHDPLTPAF